MDNIFCCSVLLSMFCFNFHMTFSIFLLCRTKVAYMKIGPSGRIQTCKWLFVMWDKWLFFRISYAELEYEWVLWVFVMQKILSEVWYFDIKQIKFYFAQFQRKMSFCHSLIKVSIHPQTCFFFHIYKNLCYWKFFHLFQCGIRKQCTDLLCFKFDLQFKVKSKPLSLRLQTVIEIWFDFIFMKKNFHG